MVELNHNVVSFNSDTLIKGTHGVIVGVFVTKTGSGNDKVVFKNGTTSSGGTEFTLFTATQGTYVQINRRFKAGIYAEVTGNAGITEIVK